MRRDRLVTPDFREYVLAELRTARLRAKMYVNEIEAIGIALRAHLVEPEAALEWMHDAATLDFLMPTAPANQRIEAGMIREDDHAAATDGSESDAG